MSRKKCIAMLLAGGQGSRLYALTTKVAKPAVSFGSKYRIIDFPLSNCVNSGIDTVGVLTQYQPLVLNSYIGNGEPWDLDRSHGGVHVLPPYHSKSGADWYKGTANAIYQNLNFIDEYDPEHVLILSGDHIYKMDYNKMLAQHISNNADCTIAVLDVPKEEAPRFGIMDYAEDFSIKTFEEKPPKPKSNHASMGIYIFKTSVLKEYLIADENDPKSSKDFGKNIIPKMLSANARMYAYQFSGYWKDVGTVTSLWEANMDLIGINPALDLDSDDFRIYSRNRAYPPQYIGSGKISNSILTAGCEVYGTVVNSVLSEGVYIAEGAVVSNSVILRDSYIGKDTVINYGIIDENVKVGCNVHVGGKDSDKNKITLIGSGVSTGDNVTIAAGEIVE